MMKLHQVARWALTASWVLFCAHFNPVLAASAEEMRTKASAAAVELRVEMEKRPGLGPLDIQKFLEAENFEYLESILKTQYTLSKAGGWREYELHRTFRHFEGYNANQLHRLNQWVSKSPSAIALTARGMYLSHRGSLLRGNRPGTETPKLISDMMTAAHMRARIDFEQAIRLDPAMIPAYTGLLEIARSTPQLQINKMAVLGSVTTIRPDCVEPRKAYLESLSPRWGGSMQAMRSFTDTLDEAAQINPLIWGLKGQVFWEQFKTRKIDENKEAIQDLTEALKYIDLPHYLENRATRHTYLKNYPAALADLESCARIESLSKFQDPSSNCESVLPAVREYMKREALRPSPDSSQTER